MSRSTMRIGEAATAAKGWLPDPRVRGRSQEKEKKLIRSANHLSAARESGAAPKTGLGNRAATDVTVTPFAEHTAKPRQLPATLLLEGVSTLSESAYGAQSEPIPHP